MADPKKSIEVVITHPCVAQGVTHGRGERLTLPVAEAMLLIGSNKARLAKATAETAMAAAPGQEMAAAPGQEKAAAPGREKAKG